MKTKNRVTTRIVGLLVTLVLCTVCFASCAVIDDCTHEWGEWTTKTAATCTEAGVLERQCTKCTKTETDTTEALGHDWNEATCTAKKTCKVCAATEGEPLPHTYTAETVKDEALKSAATCTDAAVYYKSCACGAISTSDADTFVSGTALDHKDENRDHVCDRECGKTDIGDHTDSVTDSDHVCDYGCGATLENCTDSATDNDHNCDVCGKADVTAHNYGNATCGNPATCTVCGATTGDPLTHKDENHDHACDYGCGKTDMGAHADAATDTDHVCDYGCGVTLENCYDATTDGDHACDACGKADVTNHAHVVTGSTAATCTMAATKTYTCNCGHSYVDIDGDALQHDIAGVTAIEKQVNGCQYVLVYICQRGDCGAEVTGETVYHHNHVASITTAATCKADGLKTLTCACGDVKTEPIPMNATGHDWVKGSVTDGTRTDTCTHCQATKSVTVYEGTKTGETNASDLKDKEIELNDANISLDSGVIDSIGDQKITVSADKLEGEDRKDLNLSEEKLAQVGDSPIYNFTINNGTENISNFGADNYVTITLPYTLSEGEDVDSIAVWFINDQGELESIEATYNNGYVTFKTNHFSYYTVTRLTPAERCALYGHGYVCQHVEGSCLKDGYDLYVCVRCHDKYVDEKTYVKAEGHKYATESQDATCTQSGYVLYSCENCDHSYRTTVPATGHAWAVEATQAATCTLDGFVKYGCSGCDAEYVEVSAKVAHVYTSTVTPATCTAAGYTTHDCNNCDYSFTDSHVSALGHSYTGAKWTWSSDFATATLGFTCEHDATHTLVLNANVQVTVLKGTCSNFTKTTYTATATYNQTVYTDEKVVEEGTADHSYSTDWKKDETNHWHECVCGEKADVSAHVFENATVTKAPTCGVAGESVATCVCGEKLVSVVPATGEHQYQDGICTVCGAEFVDTYYLNLVNSWKNMNGFAIKLQNLSFEIKEKDGSLAETLELIGTIKQLDVTELALFIEDGELSGAATGRISIFNGPIPDANAIYDFKAIIHEGYVYATLEAGVESATKTQSVKVSVDAMMDSIMSEMEVEEETFVALDFIKDTVIPTLDAFVTFHSESANQILEDAFNMIFTFEKQADGTYLATLDYAKLKALNENLATKNVAELVDLYFGAGAFDAVADTVLEVLALKIPEIPAYLDANGIDTKTLIEKINALAALTGAPEGYDVGEFFNTPELAEVTLGMLLFETEDDSYLESVNKAISYLRVISVYELVDPEMAAQIREAVDAIIDMVSGSAKVSFTTKNDGMLDTVKLDLNGFTYAPGAVEVTLSLNLSIVVNGKIDVTWSGIIEQMEKDIVLPTDEMLAGDAYTDYDFGYSGMLTYQGREYKYSNAIRLNTYKPDYSRLAYVIYTADCQGWLSFEACYAETRYRYTLATVVADDGKGMIFLVDEYTDVAVMLVEGESENSMIIQYEDGTQKTFTLPENADSQNSAEIYSAIFFTAFENAEGETMAMGDYVDYYYNPTTKEYGDVSHHDFVFDYQIDGESCEDGCTVTVTCTKCDYKEIDTRRWCDTEQVELDLSEYTACGGSVTLLKCRVCGSIESILEERTNCKIEGYVFENILDENGEVIGEKRIGTCAECGLQFVSAEWIERPATCIYNEYRATYIYKGTECIVEYVRKWYGEDHQYEYDYEMKGESCEDGYVVSVHCTLCGDSYQYTDRGHRSERFEIDLGEYGCRGNVFGYRCRICGEINEIYNLDIGCPLDVPEKTEQVTDEFGNLHVIETSTCPVCGLVFVTDSWAVNESVCVRYEYQTVSIYKDGELIVEATTAYRNDNHQYQIEYEMQGETCDDGYYVNRFCPICGESERNFNKGHEEEWTEISLKEFGLCGGFIEQRYCPVCDTVLHSNAHEDCCWINETADNGEFEVYRCENCNAVKHVYNEVGEKDENCSYDVSTTFVYIVNGAEVLRYTRVGHYTEHAYESTYALKGSSCTDGVVLIRSCKNCGSRYEEEYYSHVLVSQIDLEAQQYGCGNHYGSVKVCPCGSRYDVYFDSYNLEYDDSTERYHCKACELSVRYYRDKQQNGCDVTETVCFVTFMGDEELYRFEKTRTYNEHVFTVTTVEGEDGTSRFVATCSACGVASSTELLTGDVILQENKEYYFDYAFTPDETGRYTVMGLAERDTFVELYKLVDGKLLLIGEDDDGAKYNNQFLLTATLEAGVSYVYRISFYEDREGSVPFMLTKALDNGECLHESTQQICVLMPGSESCEDGCLSGRLCKSCGVIYAGRVVYDHITSSNHVDLGEQGACCGDYYFYSCACGAETRVNLNNACFDTHTENTYVDENGKTVTVEISSCSKCGLTYTISYYDGEPDDKCQIVRYFTVMIDINGKLIVDTEYTENRYAHDYVTEYTLLKGEGSSCEDGVIISTTCRHCGETDSYETTWHESFVKEIIDLSKYGSVCGGYAYLNGCACGEIANFTIDSMCEFDRHSSTCWVENALSGTQINMNGSYTSFNSNGYTDVCAVTDPAEAACGFAIRYASYWLREEGTCNAYRYRTWLIGYDQETGNYLYEITVRSPKVTAYHTYVDESTEGCNKLTCSLCGSSYTETFTYGDNNMLQKYERIAINTLNNGLDRRHEVIEEYTYDAVNQTNPVSRYYEKRVFADGTEEWNERLYNAYKGPFGDYGYEESTSFGDQRGTLHQEKRAYVIYKDYEYTIYSYVDKEDGWYRYDYTYSFDKECTVTEVYSNDRGENYTNTYNCCHRNSYNTIKVPTCTQDGLRAYVCSVCNGVSESETVPAHDHRWVWVSDQWYHCALCGLENANGVSGSIIMEDLTDAYGEGKNYVVGYAANTDVKFSYYVGLILKDGTEVIVSDVSFTELTEIRAIAFEKAAVTAWATANGYTEYDVRFSFVPDRADGSFDYGLTFAEKQVGVTGVITDNVSFSEYVAEGETKTYTVTPTADGLWIFTAFSSSDSYVILSDANGNMLAYDDDAGYDNNFRLTYQLKAGETYTVQVRWLDEKYAGTISLVFGVEKVNQEASKEEIPEVEEPKEEAPVEGTEEGTVEGK